MKGSTCSLSSFISYTEPNKNRSDSYMLLNRVFIRLAEDYFWRFIGTGVVSAAFVCKFWTIIDSSIFVKRLLESKN